MFLVISQPTMVQLWFSKKPLEGGNILYPIKAPPLRSRLSSLIWEFTIYNFPKKGLYSTFFGQKGGPCYHWKEPCTNSTTQVPPMAKLVSARSVSSRGVPVLTSICIDGHRFLLVVLVWSGLCTVWPRPRCSGFKGLIRSKVAELFFLSASSVWSARMGTGRR